MAPGNAAAHLGRQVGDGVTPAQAAEGRIDERHDRVEVAARDGTEHQDDGEEPGCGGGRVLEELQPGVPGGELLRSDSRADDDRRQEGAAQELCAQSAPERDISHAVAFVAEGQQQELGVATATSAVAQQVPSPSRVLSVGASASTV